MRVFLGDVLGLDAQRAEATACQMEHGVDRKALKRLVCFPAFVQSRKYRDDWSAAFRRFIRDGEGGRHCSECVEAYVGTLCAEGRERSATAAASTP
jgi:DtxR family Mn-dependent transcriptional regulator